MAINATTQWRIRVAGSNTNGGGFDPAISGAGTDYTDQDAAQLSLSDLATSGAASTTLTSATGGFTAAMIGNCIRISSGTNFDAGYYFVTGHTDTNTVTLDRSPTSAGAGSGGVGVLGGAFATFGVFANGGTRPAPSITTPLAAGHTIYLRGSGSVDPGSADYDESGDSNYWTFPSGSHTGGGRIAIIGYNGRPRIDVAGLLFYTHSFWSWESVKIFAQGAANGNLGVVNGPDWFYDSIYDQNNNDIPLGSGLLGFKNSVARCTGNTGGGTRPSIRLGSYGSFCVSSTITSKGFGIEGGNSMPSINGNAIHDCGSHGIIMTAGSNNFCASIIRNVIHNNGGSGVYFTASAGVFNTVVQENVITKNGGYGINCDVNTTAENDRLARNGMNRNAFGAGTFANSSGQYNKKTAGPDDITLGTNVDPYENTASNDFNLNNTAGGGAVLRAEAVTDPGGGTDFYPFRSFMAAASGGLKRPMPMNGGVI